MSDYAVGTPAYLLISTLHVQYQYNDVYINKRWIGSLPPRGQQPLFIEPFLVNVLLQGHNTLHIAARDVIGGQAAAGSSVAREYADLPQYPNIDSFWVSDARLIYSTAP